MCRNTRVQNMCSASAREAKIIYLPIQRIRTCVTYARMHTCMCVMMHVLMHAWMPVCMLACTHACMRVKSDWIRTYIYIYIYMTCSRLMRCHHTCFLCTISVHVVFKHVQHSNMHTRKIEKERAHTNRRLRSWLNQIH